MAKSVYMCIIKDRYIHDHCTFNYIRMNDRFLGECAVRALLPWLQFV